MAAFDARFDIKTDTSSLECMTVVCSCLQILYGSIRKVSECQIGEAIFDRTVHLYVYLCVRTTVLIFAVNVVLCGLLECRRIDVQKWVSATTNASRPEENPFCCATYEYIILCMYSGID